MPTGEPQWFIDQKVRIAEAKFIQSHLAEIRIAEIEKRGVKPKKRTNLNISHTFPKVVNGAKAGDIIYLTTKGECYSHSSIVRNVKTVIQMLRGDLSHNNVAQAKEVLNQLLSELEN